MKHGGHRKVLLVVPHLTDGGAERVVSELATALSSDYRLWIALYADRVSYPIAGEKILLEVPSSRLPSLARTALLSRQLRGIKKKFEIDCCVSFLVNPNAINVLSRGREKVVVSVHTHLSSYLRRKSVLRRLSERILIPMLYNRADHVVAVSKGVEDDLARCFGVREEKLATIYNGYDYERVRQLAEREVEAAHRRLLVPPVVLNIGRLSYSKGQWNLIRTFSRVRRKHESAKLVILGSGKLEPLYRRLIRTLGLEDSVFLLGFQPNPFALLRRATLLVSASKFEGLSNVILEALGLGVPVVATDCRSGPREILSPGRHAWAPITRFEYGEFGVLTPVAHPEPILTTEPLTSEEVAMGDAIAELLADSAVRTGYSKAGRARSRDFDIADAVRRWRPILEG